MSLKPISGSTPFDFRDAFAGGLDFNLEEDQFTIEDRIWRPEEIKATMFPDDLVGLKSIMFRDAAPLGRVGRLNGWPGNWVILSAEPVFVRERNSSITGLLLSNDLASPSDAPQVKLRRGMMATLIKREAAAAVLSAGQPGALIIDMASWPYVRSMVTGNTPFSRLVASLSMYLRQAMMGTRYLSISKSLNKGQWPDLAAQQRDEYEQWIRTEQNKKSIGKLPNNGTFAQRNAGKTFVEIKKNQWSEKVKMNDDYERWVVEQEQKAKQRDNAIAEWGIYDENRKIDAPQIDAATMMRAMSSMMGPGEARDMLEARAKVFEPVSYTEPDHTVQRFRRANIADAANDRVVRRRR